MLASHLVELKGRARNRYSVLERVWNHPLNSGSKVRALYDYFVWNAVRFTMRARHVVSLPCGLEIILSGDENYGTAVYVHTLSDFVELLLLAHLLREGDLFVDVGANVGMYSVVAAGITGANVIAIEPVPKTYRSLSKNIRLNNLEHLIVSKQLAVGSTCGIVAMTSDAGGLDHVVDGDASGTTVCVDLRPLDEILGQRRASAMKMDVEGFEMHALRGAHNLLSSPTLRVLIIELQDCTLRRYGASVEEISSLLREHGFLPYCYDPFGRRLLAEDGINQFNQVFVRPGDDIAARLSSAPRIRLPGYPEGL